MAPELLLMLLALMNPMPSAAPPDDVFLQRRVADGSGSHGYRVYVPADWTSKKKWPVILFLHGAGERGNDNLLQTRVGLGPAIRRQPARVPAIVVMPQCEEGRWWPEPDMQTRALAALYQTMKEYNGDPGRTYLTGISMGGYGTWSMAAANPGKFAALAPVCGGVRPPLQVLISLTAVPPEVGGDPYKRVAERIGKTPVWLFHGAEDTVVPVSESRNMVRALKAAGGDVRYSEYAGVGHNSWDRAYAEPDLFPWLLSKRAARNDRSGIARARSRR